MSWRTLIEINHDRVGEHGDLPAALNRYACSGSREDAEALELFGLKVLGMRHHSERYVVKADAEGFPPYYLTEAPPPPKGKHRGRGPMSSNPLVERVAEAICDNGGSWGGWCWAGLSEEGREMFRIDARAAIEAMAEPDENMRNAAESHYRTMVEDAHDRDQHIFLGIRAYRVMIRAALP